MSNSTPKLQDDCKSELDGAADNERTTKEDEDDHDHGEEEVQGWPLGLLLATSNRAEASAASSMVLPSCTSSSASSSSSSSSSDTDVESIGSFFPENSTSLGTLIGIHSSSQLSLMQDLSLEERRATVRRDRHHRLYSLLGCGAKIQEDPMEDELEYSIEASPAPSRYWSMDRREITQSAPNSIRIDVARQKRKMEETFAFYEDHATAHCHTKSLARSHSCSPSLPVNSKKPGPMSPWSASFPASHHSSTSDKDSRIVSRRNRLHSLWLALCMKLRSRLAIWSF